MIIKLLRTIKRSIWRGLARWMQLTYHLPNGAEVHVESYSDWCTLGDLFMNGEYDQAIDYALASYVNRTSFVFLDLGANVGFFSHRLFHRADLFKIQVGKFKGLLVEATPSLKPELQKRLSTWLTKGVDLKICSAAVGRRNGEAHMNSGSSHSRNYLSNEPNKVGWSVPFIDLESEPIARQEIDLIKCDIEGAEVLFLKEYTELLRRCRVLIMECHPPQCKPEIATKDLEAIGLQLGGTLRDNPEGVTLWFINSKILA